MNEINNVVEPAIPAQVSAMAPLPQTGRATQIFRDKELSLAVDGEIHGEIGLLSNWGQAGDACDARGLVRLYEQYEQEGPAFLRRLRGSFSLALWNSKSQSLLLAVDPFATKPIYYTCENGALAFGSRMSSFSARKEIRKEINPNALYFYLNHSFVPAPYTIFRHIRRLQPGQFLLWEKGCLSVGQYWDMTYEEDERMSEKEAAALVRRAVEDAVRIRLRDGSGKEKQLGAFLSGGTDSSTLVGLMTKVTGTRIKTFSVGFDEEPYNEIDYARVTAKHFNSQAHEYFVRPRGALEVIPVLAKEYDEPFGNSSAIPTYFCLRMAQEAGVEVMFAGDGGDELFAGNERYRTEKILSLYQEIPAWIRKWMDPLANQLPSIYPLRKVRNYVRRSNLPNPERVLSYQLYVRDHIRDFFADEFRELLEADFPLGIAREYYDKVSAASPANRVLYLDLKMAIGDNDLFKVNRMAESLGVRVRYPYLDPHLASVSGKIPVHLKIKGLNKRYIFKEAFRDLLPRETLLKKKHGFGLPTGDWLRKDPGFRDLARSLLLDSSSLQRGYFKREALEGLLRNHDEEKSNYYGPIIWNIMMLELWHQNHLD